MPQSANSVIFPPQQIQETQEGCGLGDAVTSKPALHGQELHSSLLHSLVDVPHLLLAQGPLHVAVGDAVAVAGLVCPRE